jgi:threonine/homoserine/homoserine lactone efflux protein
MTYELLIGLITFAFVSSITPGPNNLMLMSSGATFGFKQTIPHVLGVGLGFTLMILLVGIGLVQLFDLYPITYQILKVVSVVYLGYLAFKIATSSRLESKTSSTAKPFSFMQAASFQWVNPKAWTMALTAISVYSPNDQFDSIALVAIIFGLINLPCICCWTTLGQKLSKYLKNEKHLTLFNRSMASLLILSIIPVLVSFFQ